MKVGSLFSGIGGMDKGLTDAGMEIVWHVEIDKWGQKVLSNRFPDGQLYSDIREHREYEPVDLIAFEFPCTDLSVAGKRAGLEGDESRLFWDAIGIVDRLKPTWVLIENVPGLFSSCSCEGCGKCGVLLRWHQRRRRINAESGPCPCTGCKTAKRIRDAHRSTDLMVVLSALGSCGYWWSYRVLDSQYFGVAQRRRRVFIVCHLGGPCPPEILFEPCGMSGHTPEDQEAGQGVAGTLTESVGHHGHSSPRGDGGDNLVVGSLSGGGKRGYRVGADEAGGGHIIAESIQEWKQNGGALSAIVPDRSYPLLGKANSSRDESLETYVIQDAREVENKEQNGIGIQEGGPMFTLDGTSQHAVTKTIRAPDSNPPRSPEGKRRDGGPGERIPLVAVGAPADAAGVREATGVTGRLDLSMRCKCPDGPRYRGLGNAVTATVARWIGRGIMLAGNSG